MSLDRKHIGKQYGPFLYEVSREKLREFACAIAGGLPSALTTGAEPPSDLPKPYYDRNEAQQAGAQDIWAFPTFANVFSIAPFYAALGDPQLNVDLLMLVHGEQTYEWLMPIAPGMTLKTKGEITDIYERANKDFLVITTESRRNEDDALVVKAVWTAVIRRL